MSADQTLSKTTWQLAPAAAGLYGGDADRVEATATQLEETAKDLWSMAKNLGIKGESADLGADRFRRVAKEVQERADQCIAAAAAARRAHRAVTSAKAEYESLPAGQIEPWQRASLMNGATITVGGQSLTGPPAVAYLDRQAANAREARAQQILNRLDAYMFISTRELPDVPAPENPNYVPTPPTPPDGGEGVAPYPPGGTGTGSTGVGGPVTGTDRPTWTPPPGISTDPTGPTWDPAGPGPGGTDTGGGSADGSVDGTVPGSGNGPGGIGGGTGAGAGSGGAGGALAGGAAIGGAALGATGLGRAGLGMGGGLGMSSSLSVSGTSGMGAAGGLTPGARGAAGIGTTPGSSTGAGTGGRGTTGMPMGGGGAGAGSTKGKRAKGAGYLAPDLDIDDDQTARPLGPGAKAGSRDQLPDLLDDTPDPDDETW